MGENDLKRSSRNYIGKLRANFAGTEFQIFDAGWNPTAFGETEEEGAAVRAELGAVIYTSNVLGSRGPRKMQARRRVPLMVFSRRHLFRTRPRSVLGSDRGDVAASGSSPPRPSEDGAGPSRPSDGSRPRRRVRPTLVAAGTPRHTTQVAIPKLDSDGVARGGDVLSKMKAHDYSPLTYTINKPPRWNDQVQRLRS